MDEGRIICEGMYNFVCFVGVDDILMLQVALVKSCTLNYKCNSSPIINLFFVNKFSGS